MFRFIYSLVIAAVLFSAASCIKLEDTTGFDGKWSSISGVEHNPFIQRYVHIDGTDYTKVQPLGYNANNTFLDTHFKNCFIEITWRMIPEENERFRLVDRHSGRTDFVYHIIRDDDELIVSQGNSTTFYEKSNYDNNCVNDPFGTWILLEIESGNTTNTAIVVDPINVREFLYNQDQNCWNLVGAVVLNPTDLWNSNGYSAWANRNSGGIMYVFEKSSGLTVCQS